MLKNFSTTTVALAFLLCYSWQAIAAQKMIEDINFEHSGDGEERIIFKLNGTYIPKIFTLQGKQPRVVFDFEDTTAARMINNIIKTNGELIKRIRVGIHKGDNPKTRVVLDLRPNKNINIRQEFDKKEKSLVVSVHYAGLKRSGQTEQPEEESSTAETGTAASSDQKEEETKSEAGEEKTKPIAAENIAAAEEPPQNNEQLPDTKTAEQQLQPPQQEVQEVEEDPGIPTLTSITFENDSNRGEMVLFTLNEFHPPIVFGIEEGTPRVVCDFKDTAAEQDIPTSLDTAGKYIRKIRIGKDSKENKVRVVLDLTPNYSYDLQQVFFKEENLFVIIINTLGNAPTGDPSELLR